MPDTIDIEKHEDLISATLAVLATAKARITDESDMRGMRYGSAAELRFHLDTYVYQVKLGSVDAYDKLAYEFDAESQLQVHALTNGWINEYRVLSRRFDGVYKEVMKHS